MPPSTKKTSFNRGLQFDGVGLALSLVAFTSAQYLANEGERRNWLDDPTVVLAVIILALSVPAFIAYELRGTRNPHVHIRIFGTYRNLAVGSMINIFIGFSGYSVTTFVAYLQSAIGESTTSAGQLVPIRLLTYFVGVPAAFALSTYRILSIRAIVVIAVLGSSLSFMLFGHLMTTTAQGISFVGVSLLFGLFYAMLSQPIGTLVVGSIPLALLASGLSIYKLSSPIGTMIATGSMQYVLDRHAALVNTVIAGDLQRGRPVVDDYLFQHHGNAAGLAGLAASQAQTLAYSFSMISYAVVLLAIIPIIFFAQLAPPPAVKARDV